MQKHTKIYMSYFGYTIADVILCEKCSRVAQDIHHVNGRGKGKDVIENLMALCRECHNLAHSSISKKEMQEIHNRKLK